MVESRIFEIYWNYVLILSCGISIVYYNNIRQGKN
jgi:hypothetical protein